MNIVKSVFLLLFLLMIAGCSSRGFNGEGINTKVIPDLSPSSVTTDDYINSVLELKPQLHFPIRLGVYFMDPQTYNRSWEFRSWEYRASWGADDRNLDWLNPLKETGVVSEIIPITLAAITERESKPSLRDLRLAAARLNADALLIIGYGADVDRHYNFAAFLYLTIIGAYLVPGTNADAMVIMSAGLWDVRNEFLYMTAEITTEACKIGPAFLLKNDSAVKKAKEKAFPVFKKQVIQRMRVLAGK